MKPIDHRQYLTIRVRCDIVALVAEDVVVDDPSVWTQ